MCVLDGRMLHYLCAVYVFTCRGCLCAVCVHVCIFKGICMHIAHAHLHTTPHKHLSSHHSNQADVGIAMGGGVDAASQVAKVVLLGDRVSQVADALQLSRATFRKIQQNLVWAFAYNVVAIPLAAGLLLPTMGLALTPSLSGRCGDDDGDGDGGVLGGGCGCGGNCVCVA